MLHGLYSVGRVVEESVCRTSKDYIFADVGVYKIHSTSLMPKIPFEEAAILPEVIDESIFLNDEDTKLYFNSTIQCQNFLSTRYIGRAPLEYYGNGEKTKMGREFILICRGGNPNEEYRAFGTESAIRGFNKDANDTSYFPSGGD